MDKNSINRLLHTLVPFMVMAMVQRLLLLIYGHFGLDGRLADLFAFLPAAGAAILLFRVKTYHIYKEDERSETEPLKKKSTVFLLLQLLVTVTVMILLMYATAAFMGGMSYSSSQTVELNLLTIVSTLIIHPLIEEYLFRHLFYGELRLLNPIFGCMMQAVMFAIIHNTVESMTYALVSAVALAILYEQSGAIWTVITAHFCINLRSLLYLTVLAGRSNITQIIDAVLITVGCIAFLSLGVIEGRRIAAYNEADADSMSEGDGDA